MKHITDQEILAYYSHTLRSDEELALLNHTAQCSYCAGRLASSFPEEELITPPPDLQQQILQSAHRMVSAKRNQKRELFFYSARVIVAMGMTLVLLISSNFFPSSARLRYTTDLGKTDSISCDPTPAYRHIATDAREKGSKKQENIRKKTAERVEKIESQRKESDTFRDTFSSWSDRLMQSLFGEENAVP